MSRMEGENSSHPHSTRPTTSVSALGMLSPKHPFTETIMEVSLPLTWKSIALDKYEGSTNLDEHIDAYVT